ncbi:MAG: beta-propeller fold lactonase family protein, partial [Terriglobales bacterium]
MKRFGDSRAWRVGALLVGVLVMSGLAVATPQYVASNDDAAFPFLTGVSFYSVAPDGSLTFVERVQTGGYGIGGGFFGTNRLSVLDGGNQQCVYASEASTGDIVGISVNTLTVGGSATGSPTDGGTSNGIGLAMNSQYLYASFTDSNTIGTFQVKPGCSLAFVNDVSVGGLAGGIVNGMAIHGSILIATYTDGSIESFDISAGAPVSHGDKQYSTATLNSQDATYPNSIDITSDGHYAIFGDTSTSVVVEVSDISSGKLTPTVVHTSKASISSSNVMLSPDETLLWVINTQGDAVSVIYFSKTTGALSGGCTSGRLRGLSVNWSYLAGMGLASQMGNGGGVYVAEYGTTSGVALVSLTISGQKCSLQEAKKSPFVDAGSPGLL